MANRFNFVSPGAAAAGGLREHLMERELQRRQMVQEAEAAAQMKLRQAADARAASQAADTAKMSELQRQVTQAALAKGQRGDVLSRASQAGVGGEIPSVLLPDMEKFAPEMMQKMPASFAQGAQTGEDENQVPQYDVTQTAPERNVYKGTSAERVFKELQDNPNMTARDIMLKLKAAGEDLSAGDARVLSGETETQDVPTVGSFEDYVVRKYGNQPSAEQIKTAREEYRLEPSVQERPGFTYQVPSALGTEIVDGATGKTIRVLPSKLNEGSQLALRAAATGLSLTADIREKFNPDKVGPIAGRLAALDVKLWGSDPEYAAFASQLTSLANLTIQARTGAQMSKEEAQRILAEVASGTLPISSFHARMDTLEKLLRETVANVTTIGAGMLTEEQLRNLANPNVPLTGAGTNMIPGGTGAPSSAPSAPPTAPGGYEEYEVNGVRFRRPKVVR
jgi:hypothetical protein